MWDLIFPRLCICCGNVGSYFCDYCVHKRLQPYLHQRCHVCRHWCFADKVHQECRTWTNLDGLYPAFYYNDEIEKLVATAKYQFVYKAVDRWAEMIQRLIPSEYYDGAVLVPIPLAPRKQRWRGFNQAELLARRLSGYWQVPTLNLLHRTRYTETQVGMGREARLGNLRGVFAVQTERQNMFGQVIENFEIPEKVVLIDDVMTTGTTLEQCAQVLKAAGVKTVYAAVLARGAAPPQNLESVTEEEE
jgi:competence protein ComFC